MSDPRLTALKIAYKGELHRVRVDLSAFDYNALAELFASTFALAPGAFVVQYTDAEGDVLNVTSQPEYVEACRVFLASAPQDVPKSLRFSAVSRTQQLFHDAVADPILKALETLVATLTDALDKVKKEEWAQRAQAGVQTGLQHTEAWAYRATQGVQAGVQKGVEHSEQWAKQAQAGVQVGLDTTSEALTKAAQDARESLVAAKQSLQEIPFDQILKETGENLKVAVDQLQSFAHDVVGEMKKMNVAVPDDAATGEAAVVADPEWEAVAAPAPEAVAAPEPEVVAAPEPTPEELKWATEIAKVRDIFPDVETARVIEHLEVAHGNVHVVLNSLMEDM